MMLVLLGACGDPSGAAGDLPPLDPTLDNVFTHVFEPGCAVSGCHAQTSMAGDLDLSSPEAAHAALVDVAASNELAGLNGWVRVAPGDPDRSFLVRKLERPGPGEGSAMPSATQQLDPYYMALVRDWIAQGAEP